jgi:choline dehydrogenase
MDGFGFIVLVQAPWGCCPVPGRLAIESAASVLLVEAGGSNRRLTVRAPIAGPMQYGAALDWRYETEPGRGRGAFSARGSTPDSA